MNKNYDFYKSLILNDHKFDRVVSSGKLWDLVIITAISAHQKKCYEKQIETKLKKNLLPKCFKYLVFNDPDDVKIGSGGSTLNVLKLLKDQFGVEELCKMKILLIHAGGYSQRMPTCTVLGKIFGSIACHSEYINDMLDLKIAIYTPFSVHMQPGLFLASSDDFESFDFDEQIELSRLFGINGNDFILLAHKSPLNVGKDHGVYAFDEQLSFGENIFKCKFVVQKPSIQRMRDLKMVLNSSTDKSEFVFTDSAFYFSHERITPNLIQFHDLNFEKIVLHQIEIDAYRDFLQPLGTMPIPISDFLKSACNNNLEKDLYSNLFKSIYQIFSNRNSIIMQCKNSDFYHLGTVNELLNFYLNENLEDSIKFRKSLCFTRFKSKSSMSLYNTGCILNSIVNTQSKLSPLSLIEYCYFDNQVKLVTNDYCLLNNCMVNNSELQTINNPHLELNVPSNICMHTIPISNGKYLTIFFNRNDELKKNYDNFESIIFLGSTLPKELAKYENHLKNSPNDSNSIWSLKIFKSFNTMTESFVYSLKFLNDYLNMVVNESLLDWSNMYSLFDILKINDYERMISYRTDQELL